MSTSSSDIPTSLNPGDIVRVVDRAGAPSLTYTKEYVVVEEYPTNTDEDRAYTVHPVGEEDREDSFFMRAFRLVSPTTPPLPPSPTQMELF